MNRKSIRADKKTLYRLAHTMIKNDAVASTIEPVLRVGRKSIYDYLNGVREMSMYQLRAFCEYFHVSADYILGIKREDTMTYKFYLENVYNHGHEIKLIDGKRYSTAYCADVFSNLSIINNEDVDAKFEYIKPDDSTLKREVKSMFWKNNLMYIVLEGAYD